ncbi:MAG: molecular chaperone TorD family protein [Caldilineales bacterium]
MMALSPFDRALARSRAYHAFGRLFDAGITPETLPYATAIGELHAASLEQQDADQAAAAHQRLFGFNVFAYESTFLSPDAVLGGTVTERVAQFYEQAGYQTGRGETADHITNELALLAFLCGAEADAWQDGQTGEAARMQAVQRDFLNNHLLRWLPGLRLAIQQQSEPFYATLASLALEVALDHRANLPDDLLTPAVRIALPAAPDLMSSDQTGLRDIAGWLLTTAHSGIYLSRDDIGRLGKPSSLPTGFGSRRIMLTNLLRSAAQFDAVPALLAGVQTLLTRWQAGYGALQESPAASARMIGAIWLDRIAETASLLNHLGETAAAWQDEPAVPELQDV